jgi:MFS family permease
VEAAQLIRNRSLVIGTALAAGAVAGGLVGGLLAAYWWDFPPEDLIDYSHPDGPRSDKTFVVAFYSVLGVVVALLLVGFLIAAISAGVEIANRVRKRT